MVKIYMPSVIAFGVFGYIGFLYLSARYDRARMKPKINVLNLEHKIPNIDHIDVVNGNPEKNIAQYY